MVSNKIIEPTRRSFLRSTAGIALPVAATIMSAPIVRADSLMKIVPVGELARDGDYLAVSNEFFRRVKGRWIVAKKTLFTLEVSPPKDMEFFTAATPWKMWVSKLDGEMRQVGQVTMSTLESDNTHYANHRYGGTVHLHR